MLCRECGSQMSVARQAAEGGKTYAWYVCPRAECQQEVLVVRAGEGRATWPPVGLAAAHCGAPASGSAAGV